MGCADCLTVHCTDLGSEEKIKGIAVCGAKGLVGKLADGGFLQVGLVPAPSRRPRGGCSEANRELWVPSKVGLVQLSWGHKEMWL